MNPNEHPKVIDRYFAPVLLEVLRIDICEQSQHV